MHAPPNVPFGSLSLVGRSRELQTIEPIIEHTRAGHGSCVMISGEAGIGKSRMVTEISARFLKRHDGLLLQGTCFEVDRDTAFVPIIELLSDRRLRADDAASPQVSSLLRELTAHPDQASGSIPSKRRISRLTAGVLLEQASTTPLLLVFEDLHWADDATLEVLPGLIQSLSGGPVMTLLTYRSDEVDGSLRHMLATLDRMRLTTEIQLGRLRKSEVDALLRDAFQQPYPVRGDFLDMIASLTDGNPFFIEEVLSALIADGDIYLLDGRWQRKETGDLRVPRSIHDAVAQRVRSLGDSAREVLSLASVTGRDFSFPVLQRLTGMDEDALIQSLRQLIDIQLIDERSDDHFSFRHALTRQSVYGDLLARERRRLHRAVADALEGIETGDREQRDSELAYHTERAGLWEKTMHYAVQAGDLAFARFAPRAAAEQYTRALNASEQLSHSPQPSLLWKRGKAYATLGRFELARLDFETMLAQVRRSRDTTMEWEALLELGALWTGRDYELADRYFQQSLSLARKIGDLPMIARSLVQIGHCQVNQELADEAEATLSDALKIFGETGDRTGEAEALDLLGVVADISGDIRLMNERYTVASERYRDLDDRMGMASVQSNMMMTAGGYSMFETISLAGGISVGRAVTMGRQVLDLVRGIDWSAGEAYANVTFAIHELSQGHLGFALHYARPALALAEEIEHQEWMTVSRMALGCLYAEMLDFRTASEHFEQAAVLADETGSRLWRLTATGFLATNRLQERMIDDAERLLAKFDARLAMNTIGERMVWMARTRLAMAQGDPAAALDIADRLLETARNCDGPQDIPVLAKVRGDVLIALRRFTDAGVVLDSAYLGASRRGLLPLQWKIHLSHARLLKEAGRQADIPDELRRARDVIDKLAGSLQDAGLREAFRQRALDEFPADADPSSTLTARERDVLALLVQGCSNREIADQLYIGERTVETHVGNILGKLGYSSRTQVAAHFSPDPEEDVSG